MQVLRSCPRLTESASLGLVPSNWCFTKLPSRFLRTFKFENQCSTCSFVIS